MRLKPISSGFHCSNAEQDLKLGLMGSPRCRWHALGFEPADPINAKHFHMRPCAMVMPVLREYRGRGWDGMGLHVVI